MKTSRLLILAFLLLAAGVTLIFAYCNGTTGFDAGYPVSGTRIHIDITTTGYPTLIGVPCTLFGIVLLCLAFLGAILREIQAVRTRKRKAASSDGAAALETK